MEQSRIWLQVKGFQLLAELRSRLLNGLGYAKLTRLYYLARTLPWFSAVTICPWHFCDVCWPSDQHDVASRLPIRGFTYLTGFLLMYACHVLWLRNKHNVLLILRRHGCVTDKMRPLYFTRRYGSQDQRCVAFPPPDRFRYYYTLNTMAINP